MKKRGNLFLAGLAVLCFSFILLGGVVPAEAHDGTVGTDVTPIVFSDATPYDSYHVDADPWKGFFMIWTQNSTGTAWSGFNFTVSGSDAVFIDNSIWNPANPGNECSTWAFDFSCNPSSSAGVNGWTISGDQKSMAVDLTNNVADGSGVWIRVYTDNTASQGNFTVSVAPVLVPEPISSTLFLVGAASLGARRLWRKRKAA